LAAPKGISPDKLDEMKVTLAEMNRRYDSLVQENRTLKSKLSSHASLTATVNRSEEHTSELQSRENLVCRLLLEKKKRKRNTETNKKIKEQQTTYQQNSKHTISTTTYHNETLVIESKHATSRSIRHSAILTQDQT